MLGTTTSYLADTTYLADIKSLSGESIKNVALALVGTALIIVMAVKGLSAYSQDKYGRLVGLILAAVPVAGFAYFPDQTVQLIKDIYDAIVGGGGGTGTGTGTNPPAGG